MNGTALVGPEEMMKAKEMRDFNSVELKTKLKDSFQELFNLRFQAATNQLSNSNRIGQVRVDIARLKTILHERGESAGL